MHLVAFLSSLFDQHGLIVMARSGSLLGAVRGHARIPHDGDLDVLIVLPMALSLDDLWPLLEAAIQASPDASRLKLVHYPLARFFLYDRSAHAQIRWYFELPTPAYEKGFRLTADVEVAREDILMADPGAQTFFRADSGMDVAALFATPLCRCPFAYSSDDRTVTVRAAHPTGASFLFCPEATESRRLLEHQYGDSWMTPPQGMQVGSTHANDPSGGREVHFIYPNWFFRSSIGQWIFHQAETFVEESAQVQKMFTNKR